MKIQHFMALVVLSLATVPGARAAIREFKARTLALLTLACLLVAAPATAQVNYAVSGGTAYVASSPNASGNIVIASTFNGYPVTSIGDYAFPGCTNLTSVTIPNSVTNMECCYPATQNWAERAQLAFRPRTFILARNSGKKMVSSRIHTSRCCDSVSLWQPVYPAFFACAFGSCPRSC